MIFGGRSQRVQEHQQALAEAWHLTRKWGIREIGDTVYFDVSAVPLEMRSWFHNHLEDLAAHVSMTAQGGMWQNKLGDRSTLAELQETLHYVRIVDQQRYTSVSRAGLRAIFFDEIFGKLREMLAEPPKLDDLGRGFWAWAAEDAIPHAEEALSWYRDGLVPTECKNTLPQAEWMLAEVKRHTAAVRASMPQSPGELEPKDPRCPKCGEVNKPGAKFCCECAHKF